MTATRNVTIRYFASVREGVGREQETISTRVATVGALRDELIARSGAHARMLARGRAVRIALNQVMCDEDAALPGDAEVAFFPPVTGG